MIGKKKVESATNVTLCEGVSIVPRFFEKQENRILILILKGIIVYLLSMGSLGFYMSAFNIEYNRILCHIVILIMAIFCSLLYYRLLFENLGYIILFASFAFLVMIFKVYINSGFYAVVNITVQTASTYFDVDVQRLYTEQIENRYATVTMFILFTGIVLNIVLNVYISRRMKYVQVFWIIMFFNMIPLYLTLEPSILYSFMVLGGIAAMYVFKSSKHYCPEVESHRNNKVNITRKKKFFGRKKLDNSIDYKFDVKAMYQSGLVALAFSVLIVTGVRSVKPVESFNTGYTANKYKNISMIGFSTFLLEGFEGFRREGKDVAGLYSGELGTVGSVKIDGQTDLVLQFTPYNYDTIYLRGFVGDTYLPYQNRWVNMLTERDDTDVELSYYKKYFDEGGENSAMGIMRQRMLDPEFREMYLFPYYTGDVVNEKNGFYSVTYYPNLDGNKVWVDNILKDGENSKMYLDTYLHIPSENVDAIDSFLNEMDAYGTDEENIERVVDYFKENIPYTVKPGKTPKNKDYINYFLTTQRKGYCAHYASAAVLIFRAMGIPARYVEGYAVSYNQITMNAELVEGKQYKDYYEGYSELGETALVSINVTDADAHAWVEVYKEGKGWIPVEVTPSSDDGEEYEEEFWDSFEDTFYSNNSGVGILNGGQGLNFNVSDKTLRTIWIVILIVLSVIVLVILTIKVYKILLNNIRYSKADNNDRLIMAYSEWNKKQLKGDKAYKKCYNYHMQLDYIRLELFKRGIILDMVLSFEKFEDILTRAGFSNKQISDDELKQALLMMKNISLKGRRRWDEYCN